MPAKKLEDLMRDSSRVNGKWTLDKRHRLTYSSQDDHEQFELEASLVAVEENALVVSVAQTQEKGRTVTSLVKLEGVWRANEKNQLEFEVAGRAGKTGDVLTFTGSWTVDENHEIVYSYRARARKGKTSQIQTLTFKGYWDITEKNRLTYLIEGNSASAFRFRGAFQTTSILAKKGEIRYLLGIETKGKRQKLKTITLFGKWRLSDKLELSFEIEYAGGEKREIRFGAEYNFTDDFSVAAQLIQKSGDPLGVEVILSKDFLKTQAKAFVRLRKTLRESAVEAGISIPW